MGTTTKWYVFPYLFCVSYVCLSSRFCQLGIPFQLFRSLHVQSPLAALVLMVSLCHMLVLNCFLYQESALKWIVLWSQGNALHQQQPACYSKDICVSPLVPSCPLILHMPWSTLLWHLHYHALDIWPLQGLHIPNMPQLHACNEHKP